MWLARRGVVEHCLENCITNMKDYGVEVYVVTQPYSSHMVSVGPLVTELPMKDGTFSDIDADGEPVVAMLFDNMHRYRFLWDALRQIDQRCVNWQRSWYAVENACYSAYRCLNHNDVPLARDWLGLRRT